MCFPQIKKAFFIIPHDDIVLYSDFIILLEVPFLQEIHIDVVFFQELNGQFPYSFVIWNLHGKSLTEPVKRTRKNG